MKPNVNNTVQKVEQFIKNGNNLIPDNYTDFITNLIDMYFKTIMSILNPVYVEGYFDDLIGQQLILHIILFVLVISLIFLFLFYIINNLIILNKNKILSKFNNKYVKFYLKYQLFLA